MKTRQILVKKNPFVNKTLGPGKKNDKRRA